MPLKRAKNSKNILTHIKMREEMKNLKMKEIKSVKIHAFIELNRI